MKKIIFLLSVSLLFITGNYAQSAWEVLVNWDDSDENCACSNYATASFKIVFEVSDVANGEQFDPVTVFKPYTASSHTFDCSDDPDIEYYCNEINHEYTPSFTIRCSVTLGHYGSIPVVEHCTDSEQMTGQSCLNFSNGFTFTSLYLE
jgi:hypothetical protein